MINLHAKEKKKNESKREREIKTGFENELLWEFFF